MHARNIAGQTDQTVGFTGHCRNHNRHIMSGIKLALHMRGNIADTRNIPNRSATEFHHDTCHDVPVSLRRLTVYML